jgi:hypothetical protein
VFVAGDVELIARGSVEGSALIGPNLGRDSEGPQEAEGSPGHGRLGHVEVDGDLAAASQVNAAGGVEEARELGETIAGGPRRDPRELAAQLLRE